jgi:hypothetical protein
VCKAVAVAYEETAHLPDEARRAAIAQRLAPLNQGDVDGVNPDRGKVFEFKALA